MAQRTTDSMRMEGIRKIKGPKGKPLSEQEYLEILAYDKAVEAGERTEYDLTPQQEAVAREMCRTGTRQVKKKPISPNFPKRQRESNPTKAGIISELEGFFREQSRYDIQNLTVLNAERLISFTIGDNTFEVTLTQKRKPKN